MASQRQDNTLLLGRGARLERVSAEPWRHALASASTGMRRRLAFMTSVHRQVRNAAVLQLPRNHGRPASTRQVSDICGLPERQVDEALNDLHKNLFFLVRARRGDVAWAFPVTVDRTPHHLTFSSGERLWGA